MWYSRKYDMSPMPHSIFFKGGYAIHGTNSSSGSARRPRTAACGCIRTTRRQLFALVRQNGMANTQIIVTPVASGGMRRRCCGCCVRGEIAGRGLRLPPRRLSAQPSCPRRPSRLPCSPASLVMPDAAAAMTAPTEPSSAGRGGADRPLRPDDDDLRRRELTYVFKVSTGARRLHHAGRALPGRVAVAAPSLAEIRQRADAMVGVLPRRLRHTRHHRHQAARHARPRTAASGSTPTTPRSSSSWSRKRHGNTLITVVR